MDEEIKGKAENLRGRATEAVGAASGQRRTQARGLFTRIRGALREMFGRGQRRAETRRV